LRTADSKQACRQYGKSNDFRDALHEYLLYLFYGDALGNIGTTNQTTADLHQFHSVPSSRRATGR
jgi:hypothetical protein